jgi:ankyrin repeat protein
MLAEAFEEDFRSFYLSEKSEPELLHKLDLLGVYGRFIDSKYDIFFKEKAKFHPSNIYAERILERESKTLQVEHQLLALEALFGEDQVTFLQSYDRTTFSDEELDMIGIAQRNNEGKPHFVHQTFAEYFVADFLIKQLTRKTKQNKQLKELLLNEVLLRKDCRVIRAFLNGLLEISKPSTEALKEYGDLLDERWNKGEQELLIVDSRALHDAAEENNPRIIGFLLESLNSGKHSKALKMMLLAKDTYRRTAWHVAAEAGHIKVVEDLCNWAKARLTPRELMNGLLLGQDLRKRTVWHVAAKRGQVQMLVDLLYWAKQLEIKPEELRNVLWLSKDDNGQTAWHIAAEEGHVDVLERLWDWAKELNLKPHELKNDVWLSEGEFSQTAWYKAANGGHIVILLKLWEWAKQMQLNREELKNEVCCPNASTVKQPGTLQQEKATL